MSAYRNNAGIGSGRCRAAGGYSLIEMIVALFVSAVIGMALYALFNAEQRSSRSQKTYNDLQSSCTFAMDTLKSDLLLAGYRARTTTQPISAANPSDITFEFYDDKAQADLSVWDASYTPDTKVTYSLAGGELKKTVARYKGSSYTNAHTMTLAENIQALNFAYLREDNTSWSAADGMDTIRTIRFSLLCRAGKSNAIYNAPQLGSVAPTYQEISLTAEVKPRNVNIARNPEDHTAPRVPASQAGGVIYAWDEGRCGCLQVKWTSNTDSDIAGYTVFYGPGPGNYIGRVRVTHQSGAFQTATLTNLESTNVPYSIAIAAYDNSGNQSNFSIDVSGNPTPSRRSEPTSVSQNDTTITPLPPPAPGGLTVATPGDNKLLLSWSNTYADCLSTPVYGFNIYRTADLTISGGSWDFIPNSSNLIATLGPEARSYLDTGVDTAAGKLVGCVPYYYKIAVRHCDPAKLSGYAYPDTTVPEDYKSAQFAKISGTPTDGTPPSAPTLTSKSGFKRIILSVTNPSRSETENPDFMLSRIYWSTTGYPVLTDTRDAEGYNVITGGALIPDGGGKVAAGGGPHTINFDDTDSEIPNGHTCSGTLCGLGYPELDPNSNYFFLAVAYDRCKNHNEFSVQAQQFAIQCGDGPEGAPPPPTNVRVTRGCEGRPLKVEWDYDPANYTTNLDFQGFRVVRCTGKDCTPLDPKLGGSGTVIGGTYMSPDSYILDDTVDDGLFYSYRVYAGDCYYQRWLEGLSTDPTNDPRDNASWFADIGPTYKVTNLALGYLDRAQLSIDATTTLSAAIDDVDTRVYVANSTGFGGVFRIGTEVIRCATKVSNYFEDCKRGAEATMPIAHYAGDLVTSFPPAPPTPAVTGDLTLSPPTFLHNSVRFGARNTSAGQLTLTQAQVAWGNEDARLKSIQYYVTVPPPTVGWNIAFQDTTTPLMHGSAGSTVSLGDAPVAGKTAPETTVPFTFDFRNADGTATGLNMRQDQLGLTWAYANVATGITTCSRPWLAPDPSAVAVPLGPLVSGTTQNRPATGTFAWPVSTPTAMNTVIVPGGSAPIVSTYVKDNSGFGIASVSLYFYSDPFGQAGTLTAAPSVTGVFDACAPYTRIPMTNVSGELWQGTIPNAPSNDGKNVWYFIVAVDNRGNFDREPEIGQGAFQYQQLVGSDCDNTPKAPVVNASSTSSSTTGSVTLDWSNSWYGTPAAYRNADEGICTDLLNFKILRRTGTLPEVVLDTLPGTQTSYTDTYATISNPLTAAINSAETTLPANTYGFMAAGMVQIGSECITYASVDAGHFLSCQRGQRCPGDLLPSTPVAHATGASVYQDALRFMNNTYRVQANDKCAAASGGPKHAESAPWTEAEGAPACLLVVNPTMSVVAPPNAFNAGDTFTIDLTIAAQAGGGRGVLYAQTCSAGTADADPIRLVEEVSDNGVFHIDSAYYGRGYVKTYLSADYPASFIDLDLKVDVTDTVNVGGWAVSTNPGGLDWNTYCQNSGYTCGSPQTLSVVAPVIVVDQCALTHTPSAPASLAITPSGNCSSSQHATLSWPQVTPPDANYTTFRYNGYKSTNAGSTWAGITGMTWTCAAGTCTSNLIDVGSKLNTAAYVFGVSAEYEIDSCPATGTPPSTIRTWESATMTTVNDPCP